LTPPAAPSPAPPAAAKALAEAAQAALLAQRPEEAQALFGRLARMLPRDPRGPVGLARAAFALGRPEQALEQLAEADRRSGGGRRPWRLLRAQILASLGEAAAAEALLRELIAEHTSEAAPRIAYAGLLRRAGRLEEALALLRPLGLGQAVGLRLGVLVQLRRLSEARATLHPAIATAPSLAVLEEILPLVALLHGEDPPAALAYAALEERLAALAPSGAAEGRLLAARLHLAAGRRAAFLEEWAALPADARRSGPLAPFLQAAAAGAARRPKVFGIGLSRTGTTSLHEALTRLGLVSAHWSDPLTGQMLGLGSASWLEAMTDIPTADMMEELAARHPDARFIVTERPLESWIGSVAGLYRAAHGVTDFDALRAMVEQPSQCPYGARWRAMHRRIYTGHAGFAEAHAAHAARVRACFADAPGRLLRLDLFAGQGWPELCAFLGLPRPDVPFPHSNRAR
jgi:hypothetical protein